MASQLPHLNHLRAPGRVDSRSCSMTDYNGGHFQITNLGTLNMPSLYSLDLSVTNGISFRNAGRWLFSSSLSSLAQLAIRGLRLATADIFPEERTNELVHDSSLKLH